METAAITLRHIWTRRNAYVYQEKLHSPDQVNMAVLLEKEEYISAQCHSHNEPPLSVQLPPHATN